jgi:hypothetical protein
MKRIVLLTGIALIGILGAAPDAMANHCFRCKLFQQSFDCVAATGTTPGYPICQTDGITCQTSGTRCTAHTASVAAPLASEYAVASVKRLDVPDSGVNETLVAQTQTAKSIAP